jgi:tetratricopeptide (TPR) repeat protein
MRLFERIGKPAQEAQALTAAAWFAARLGDYEWAMAAAETALGLHRKYDNRFSESDTLYTIGYVHQLTDRSVDALDHYRQALAGFREVGNTQEEADTLYRIGQLEVGFGSPDAARMLWQQALVLYRAHRRTAEVERTERDLAGLD